MRRIILLVLTVIVSIVVRAPLAAAKPYAIPNTQEQHIRSKFTGAGYRLFISLPDGYSTSGKSYPVVYMLDADYSFALVRNVVQHFGHDSQPPLAFQSLTRLPRRCPLESIEFIFC